MTRTHPSLAHLRTDEAIEYRVIFAMSYPVFLLVAATTRLLSFGRRRQAPLYGAPRSIFEEARVAANTCVTFAFMR